MRPVPLYSTPLCLQSHLGHCTLSSARAGPPSSTHSRAPVLCTVAAMEPVFSFTTALLTHTWTSTLYLQSPGAESTSYMCCFTHLQCSHTFRKRRVQTRGRKGLQSAGENSPSFLPASHSTWQVLIIFWMEVICGAPKSPERSLETWYYR